MKKPLISVVVPIYNVQAYVGKCVESLLQQTHTACEIILVDDGSTDDSGKICDRYVEKDERVRVLHKANGGVSSARNAGVAAMRGEFLAFVDPDDWVELSYLEELAAPLLKDETIDMVVGCFYLREDGQGVPISEGKKGTEGYLATKDRLRQMMDGVYWDESLCGKLYKGALWTDFSFPDAMQVGEDLYANWQILQRAKKVYYTPSQRYHYALREGSLTNSPRPENRFGFLTALHEIESTREAREDTALYRSVQARLFDVYRDVVRRMVLDTQRDYTAKLQSIAQAMSQQVTAAAKACVEEPEIRRVMVERSGSYNDIVSHYQKFLEELHPIADRGELYLYGAGTYAMAAQKALAAQGMEIRGFIISDDRPALSHSPDGEHPVLFLRQLQVNEAYTGVLLCLGLRDMTEVLPGIRMKGVRRIFYW